jgi:hypothetical protein
MFLPLKESMIKALKPVIGTFDARVVPIIEYGSSPIESGLIVIHSDLAAKSPYAPIDTVAAVIDCHEVLTLDGLRESYRRLEALKLATKSAAGATVNAVVDMTTGFIIARTSDVSIEELAAEMARLNGLALSGQWPDGVAVLSTGFINYTAEIPGRGESGDFFLPAKGLAGTMAPAAIYVSLMVRATAELTFNKLTSMVVSRVAIFQPGIAVPDYRDFLAGIPRHGIPEATYQFNLAGKLMVMSQQQIIASRLNFEALTIESGNQALGSVQFMEWQDGGVIIVRGEFPILPFFICLTKVAPGIPMSDMQYVGSDKMSVSFVLPIDRGQFLRVLGHFQAMSSNIRVKAQTAKLLVQKSGTEGASSPFVSRLMISIMEVRDAVWADDAERRRFDDLYEPALSGVRGVRDAHREIVTMWAAHSAAIRDGRIVRPIGRQVHIDQSIDRPIRRELDSFLTTAVRTIKNAMQTLTASNGIDIGFLFRKEAAFQAGLARLALTHPTLAAYLKRARDWSEPLVNARNTLEHGVLQSVKVDYDLDALPVLAREPEFEGKTITTYAAGALDRVACFVEEVTVYCLSTKLPKGVQVSEVPLIHRESEVPRRFRLSVSPGGRWPWALIAHTRKFEEV